MSDLEERKGGMTDLPTEIKAILYERVGSPFFAAVAVVAFFTFWRIPAAIVLADEPFRELNLAVENYATATGGKFWELAAAIAGKAFLLTLIGGVGNVVFVAVVSASSAATRTIRRKASGYELISRKEKTRLEDEILRISAVAASARMDRAQAESLRDEAMDRVVKERERSAQMESELATFRETETPPRNSSNAPRPEQLKRAMEAEAAARQLRDSVISLELVVEDLTSALRSTGEVRDEGNNHYIRMRAHIDDMMVRASKYDPIERLLRQMRTLPEPNEREPEKIEEFCANLERLVKQVRQRANGWHTTELHELETMQNG